MDYGCEHCEALDSVVSSKTRIALSLVDKLCIETGILFVLMSSFESVCRRPSNKAYFGQLGRIRDRQCKDVCQFFVVSLNPEFLTHNHDLEPNFELIVELILEIRKT